MPAMIVPIAPSFVDYVEAALVRLRYLHPRAQFTFRDGGIEVSTDEDGGESIARDVNYTLYRERVLQETLSLRRALIAVVTGR